VRHERVRIDAQAMATHGRSREPNDPLQRYGSHEPQRQMRDLVMQWDAIGVAELDGPVDEYDCMIDPQTRCRVGLSPRPEPLRVVGDTMSGPR